MTRKTHYETLGLASGAAPDEIKRAYRQLAMKWHPDRNSGKDASARFKEINAAYECLKDERRRASYDHMLEREKEWAREEARRAEAREAEAKARQSSARASTKRHSALRRSGAPPRYAMFACALVALLGWSWVGSPHSPVEAATSPPQAPPAAQAVKEEVPPPAPPKQASAEELQNAAAEHDNNEIVSLRAEIDRLKATQVAEAESRQMADARNNAERDALRVEIARLQSELHQRDEIQRTAERRAQLEKDRVRAEKMARWAALTGRLFGAPLQDGLPCDMPVLRGQRCYDVILGFPDALSFTFGTGKSQQFEVNLSPSEWKVTSNRRGSVYPDAFSNTRWNEWELSLGLAGRHLVENLGFSREMLAACVTGSHVTLTSDYEYRCRHIETGAEVVRVAFTVRPRNARR